MWSEGDGQEVWEGREGDAGVGWGQGGREVGKGHIKVGSQGRVGSGRSGRRRRRKASEHPLIT